MKKQLTVVVSGSRTITNRNLIKDILSKHRFEKFHKLIHGGAHGVDQVAASWAELWGVEVEEYPADWDRHGKAAGPIRNKEMAAKADALIAIWDGKSRGTKQMIDHCITIGLPLKIELVTLDESSTK
jgi:hypothetical protein